MPHDMWDLKYDSDRICETDTDLLTEQISGGQGGG